jgi:hypothetical protein
MKSGSRRVQQPGGGGDLPVVATWRAHLSGPSARHGPRCSFVHHEAMIRNGVLAFRETTCQAKGTDDTAIDAASSKHAKRAVSGHPACAARSIAAIRLTARDAS